MCIWAEHCSNTHFRFRLEQIYNPCDVPEDVMKVDLVTELRAPNGYTHILTACDIFSWYRFAVPLQQPSTSAVTCALLQFFCSTCIYPLLNTNWQNLCIYCCSNEKSHEQTWHKDQSRCTQTCADHRYGRTKPSKAQTNLETYFSWRYTPLGSLRQPRHHGPQHDVPIITEMHNTWDFSSTHSLQHFGSQNNQSIAT